MNKQPVTKKLDEHLFNLLIVSVVIIFPLTSVYILLKATDIL
jgi:hypothetical protein